ncbi:TerD family protein [Amycolatopsis sp. H20-H5]|uniref:TerD family protein n=1 Tax=Amycolatopsis sp. H20-H5 TaxID=3046309 RepID=UPI002DB998E4|nr:TerD family protein [Amycolatopsis sp. H20-H5]MEC3982137.1 TerD family protein [Amycolatopsis sp. H20-H5]
MTVSLSKGQRVSLTKHDGATLTRVRMGLGWDAMKKRGFFGMKSQTIDLDASALLFDAGGHLVDQVWFNQLKSLDGSVRHTGDNLTGDGDGDDESITVDLARLPRKVAAIVFTVNSFTGQNFSQIENAFCRLVDESNATEIDTEIARYDLTGSGSHTAQIMAKLSRDEAGWSMTAIGSPTSGRTFKDLLPTVSRHL